MRTMHPDLLRKTFRVQGSGYWSFAYRIVIDEAWALEQEPQWRLTCWRDEVTLDYAGGGGVLFYPYAIAHTDIYTDLEASVPTFDVVIDNTTLEVGRYNARGDGYRGKRVEVHCFNVASVALGPAASFHGYVQGTTLHSEGDRRSFILSCSLGADIASMDLPHDSYEPHRCRHREYAMGRCGMIVVPGVTPPDMEDRCPRHWDACSARAAWMASVGLPPRLPMTYGGQPGIPLERGIR